MIMVFILNLEFLREIQLICSQKNEKKISTKIHGFDSFEGLREDWKGHVFYPKGSLNLNKKLPLTQKTWF